MEMSELPQGWRSCQLADVTLPYTTCDPIKQPEVSFTYIDLSSVDNESGRIVSPKILQGKDAPSRARKVVKVGDVIFATTRPYLKGIALVPTEYDEQVCSTGFSVLRAQLDVLLPQWLYYLCRSNLVLDQVLPHMRGASYPAVTDRDILAATIPIPPLDEQRRIVARVEELAAKIERARGLRRKAVEETALAVPVAARTLIADIDAPVTELRVWLDQRRDGIQTGPFGAQLGTGDFVETGVPVLTIGNVQYSGLKLDSLKYVSEGKAQQLARFMVKAGDILFARMGTVGRCCVVPQEADGWLINYHIIRVALDTSRIDPRFIHWTIQALAEVIVTAEQLGRLHEQSAGVYGAIPQL